MKRHFKALQMMVVEGCNHSFRQLCMYVTHKCCFLLVMLLDDHDDPGVCLWYFLLWHYHDKTASQASIQKLSGIIEIFISAQKPVLWSGRGGKARVRLDSGLDVAAPGQL